MVKLNKCVKCGLEFEPFHYYVQLANGEFMDEQCFFDYALEQLKAKSVHNDYRGEIETLEEDYSMANAKTYKVEFILEGDKLTMNSHNDGFDVLQLIGLLERKKDDLLTQIRDSANFNRKCVMDDGVFDITEKEVVKE